MLHLHNIIETHAENEFQLRDSMTESRPTRTLRSVAEALTTYSRPMT